MSRALAKEGGKEGLTPHFITDEKSRRSVGIAGPMKPSPPKKSVLPDRIKGRQLSRMAIFPAVGMAGFALKNCYSQRPG